jgi:hypothetical protein
MKKGVRDSVSFVTIALLVFVGSHFFLLNYFSSGPNFHLSFGWLDLNRHGDNWTFEQFHLGILIADIIVSVVLTWVLSKIFRRRIT